MKNLNLLFSLLILVFGAISCSDSDESNEPQKPGDKEEMYAVNLTVTLPEDVAGKNVQLSDIMISFKEINTGKVYNFPQAENGESFSVNVKKGLYNITFKANLTQEYEGKPLTTIVNGYKQSITVIDNNTNVEIPLFYENEESGFVLAELFFTGTLTPQGSKFYADKYFVIYNNSDKTLYADSLAIAESKFLTVIKADYQPNIMDEAMAVQAIYMIPGDGKTYPVKPGESLLLCDNALDHTKANPNSFDLTKADFEWVDESTNPSVSDVNNPNVADLKKVYCYTATVWSPHNRGYVAYALAKMKTDIEDYLLNYSYIFNYMVVGATGELPMTERSYKIPNDWIVDAVNLSVESLFKWTVVAPSLDRGWTHCGEFDDDMRRYGRSVRRKVVSHTEDGRAILMDTNNSTVDFEAEQAADPYHKF